MSVRSRSVYLARCVSGLFGLAMYLWLSPVFAVTYEAGPAPTAEISHNTVETIPGPTSRTTIGIKEEVSCAISNWSDTDIEVDGDVRTDITDNYNSATITWVPGTGQCNPTTGPSTTYTAPESASDTSDTVTMTVDDTPHGDDAAIEVTLDFTIKVPTGHAATIDYNSPLGDPGPPDDYVGAQTYYWPQVTPTDVSFKNVDFRENIPQQTEDWPCGAPWTFGPQQWPWGVGPRNGSPNIWTVHDQRTSGEHPASNLWEWGIDGYVDFPVDRSIPWEFDAGGAWHSFTDPPMRHRFYADLTTKTSFDNLFGSLQGPYKD